jgi:hypothetical protein
MHLLYEVHYHPSSSNPALCEEECVREMVAPTTTHHISDLLLLLLPRAADVLFFCTCVRSNTYGSSVVLQQFRVTTDVVALSSLPR